MTTYRYTLSELPEIAHKILQNYTSKTFLFYGPMGIGKTTLIKELVRQLGSSDNVSSPTFSLVNEYASKEGPIYHFDLYRIQDEEEALDIGLEDYFDSGNWLFVEWPDKIPNFLPSDFQKIVIERKAGKNQLHIQSQPF